MLRCNYTAEYFNYHVHTKTFHSLGRVVVGMHDSFDAPKHGHIALTTEANAMTVMFNSASQQTPRVKFGLTRELLDRQAAGTSTSYAASDMYETPPQYHKVGALTSVLVGVKHQQTSRLSDSFATLDLCTPLC
jgi:hypothetical protein